ncbi:MAG: multidrug effflux MFS transporter [Alphaproteobacteria bacterium]
MTRAQRIELIVILGALTAFAPMSIDMYLPALPTLERVFAADTAAVQRTLSAFFLGFAGGQALYGPLIDRFGRKRPLYVGLAVFVLASAGCALAPTIAALTAFRIVQALGACVGVVCARAMVRDLFQPIDAARVFSALILVMGVAPILAPLAGGFVLVHAGWAAIFWTLGAFGLACLAAAWLRLAETHDRASARPLSAARVLADYLRLLTSRLYMGYALTGGLGLAGMFAYIAGAPFLFIELNGVAPEHFGWIFGTNALGFVVAAQINARVVGRWGLHATARAAVVVEAAAMLVLLAVTLADVGGLAALWAPIFVAIATLGFLLPNTTALAMAPFGDMAGVAAALLGTLQFAFAAVTSMAIGLVHDGTAVPLAATMAACAAAGLAANLLLTRRV